MLHLVVEEVTAKLEIRSKQRRQRYLQRLQESLARPPREQLGCSNLAHALAAQPHDQRLIMKQGGSPHIAIISSYNDLLSAHQPLQDYPQQLKQALAKVGATGARRASIMACSNSLSRALRFSGRFIQMVLTGPLFSMMTLLMTLTPARYSGSMPAALISLVHHAVSLFT